MGVHVLEFPEVGEEAHGSGSPRVSHFAGWPPLLARIALAALALLLAASALVQIAKSGTRSPWEGPVEVSSPAAPGSIAKPYDQDIALYEAAIARIRKGENYYDFIVPEHRAWKYPVKPQFAVRLPTLAYLDARLGAPGQIGAALALMFGIIIAWWRRFGDEGISYVRRAMATAVVSVAASLAVNRHYFPLHELWAGGLIALSFGLHRIGRNGEGGRWLGAFCAAALALAIRELTLPFVLLMLATALWYRNRKEALAWTMLVALFACAMAVHISLIERQVLPSDPHSAPWLVMRGLSGWLGNVSQASNLRWLPHFLAGPAVVLMTFGWLGFRGRTGTFGFLLSAGYGVAFMLAGRWDNFYWGAMIAPAMFAGIAFAPCALAQLVAAARLPIGASAPTAN
ncbi:hypothetical protein [Novosphingobium sp.]|uniref:hypothetical protein n=1 Tax=Novosphingobium sp. TaxID=1874826 RepID=UPI002B493306|nr:hypothetical protein [Novosphingobium sp.]HKR91301.1 hypothetical protein [Novosphingobium sp.]